MRLYLEVYILFFLVNILLRLRGFRSTVRWLTHRFSDVQRRDNVRVDDMEGVCETVDRVGLWYPGRMDCLPRSLVAFALLRAEGFPVDLCLGVTSVPSFESHIWLECDGWVLNDYPYVKEQYIVMWRSAS